jgi:hypothetical protein
MNVFFATRSFLSAAAFILPLATSAHAAESVPLRFAELELTDGRQLTDVVVKSYDAKSEKLFVLAGKTALSLPIALFPPPLNEQLKAAPASRGAVSTVPGAARAPTSAQESEPVAVPSTPAPANPVAIEAPPPVPNPPAQRPVLRPKRSSDSAEPSEPSPTRHQFVVRSKATRYYRYEHQIGSNSISITSLEFDLTPPRPVPGYPGRYQTDGKAFLEYYDSKGRSVQRATSTFEMITEAKPGEEIKVIDFVRKS